MPRSIRFHLDENCDNRIARGLRRHGIDVTTTYEVGLGEASDEEHIEFALADDRTIFTHDADMVALHRAAMPHRGIIFSPKDRRTIGVLIQGLILIWEVYESDEMANRLEFL